MTRPAVISRDEVVGRAHGNGPFSPADLDRLDHVLAALANVFVTESGRARLVADLRWVAGVTRRAHRASRVARPLAPPVVGAIVLGTPRSGTTAVLEALVRAGVGQSVLVGETADPFGPGPTHGARKRVADQRRARSPGLSARHRIDPAAPTEDWCLAMVGFRDLPLPQLANLIEGVVNTEEGVANLPAVMALVDACSGPRRWILKRPGYLRHVDLLAGLFPGAPFVLCVRDPDDGLRSALALARILLTPLVGPDGLEPILRRAAGQFVDDLAAAVDVAERYGDRVLTVRTSAWAADVVAVGEWLGRDGETPPWRGRATTPRELPGPGASWSATMDAYRRTFGLER